MATKTTKKAELNLAETVRDSTEEIWMAGLGAFAKAQKEGTKVFDALVSEGKLLQSKVRDVAGSVADKLSNNAVTELTDKTLAGWTKLGQMLEDRASNALGRFGVATKKDVEALSRRIAKLTGEIEKAKGGVKPAATARRRRSA